MSAQINKTEWMVAYEARRALGEAPEAALANSYTDVTGGSYQEYKEIARTKLSLAGAAARRAHEVRARNQRNCA